MMKVSIMHKIIPNMLIICFCFACSISCSGPAGSDGTNGTAGKDAGAFGEIYFDETNYTGSTDTASISLEDANLTVSAVNITVKSSSDSTGTSISLAGSNGQYSGIVGFSKVSSGSGKIKVKDGDAITAVYNDANPVGVRSCAATWNDFAMSPTGVVTFDQSNYFGLTQSSQITLVDSDLTGTTVNVNVKSSSDTTGITISLTGSSGTYAGTVGFTSGTSGSGKIKVADGNTITVTYSDANPVGSRTDTALWQSSSHGFVYFDSDKYSYLLMPALITVVDQDIIGSTIDVKVVSSMDSTGITLNLTETNDGVYTGYLGLTTEASSSNRIKVFDNGTITVTYNESDPAGSRTDIAKVNCYSGSITFGDTNYYGYIDEAIIKLTDLDAAQYDYNTYKYVGPSTIDVLVTSSSDATGLNVSIFRQENSYLYNGCVGFTSGASGDRKIKIKAGDTITVKYTDQCPSVVKTATAIWNP